MIIITSKAEVKKLTNAVLETYSISTTKDFVQLFRDNILKKKIKFPLLEYSATELFKHIPFDKQIKILDKIIAFDEIGSYVIAGKILQLRMEKYFGESLQKAQEYFITGNKWYCCDIISERVMGEALLRFPEKTITELHKIAFSENYWVKRSVGVAAHYSVKKGLEKNLVEKFFLILLKLADSSEYHTKTGIGWGAKTVAKFHPGIINKYKDEIYCDSATGRWFISKVNKGLKYSTFLKNKSAGKRS